MPALASADRVDAALEGRRAGQLEALAVGGRLQAVLAVVVQRLRVEHRIGRPVGKALEHLLRRGEAVLALRRRVQRARRRQRLVVFGRRADHRVDQHQLAEAPRRKGRGLHQRMRAHAVADADGALQVQRLRPCAAWSRPKSAQLSKPVPPLRPWPRCSTAITWRPGSWWITWSHTRPWKPVACTIHSVGALPRSAARHSKAGQRQAADVDVMQLGLVRHPQTSAASRLAWSMARLASSSAAS